MKTTPAVTPTPLFNEDDIRSYAEHLWAQSGRTPGRDLDNWLEAKACLESNVPQDQSHRRLHEHLTNGRARAAAKERVHAA